MAGIEMRKVVKMKIASTAAAGERKKAVRKPGAR